VYDFKLHKFACIEQKITISLLIPNYIPPLDDDKTTLNELHGTTIVPYRAKSIAMTTPKTPAVPSRAAALPLSPLALALAGVVWLLLALEVGVPVALPEAALLSHVTSSGRSVTPAVEQICLAYLTAVSLPAASHLSSRQHAMPDRKSLLLQMHLTSSCPHPATPPPVVYLSTHGCYIDRRD
jgi:hypothetical protein